MSDQSKAQIEATAKSAAGESDAAAEAKDGPREQEVDVLYQRLGDRWFAFSIVDDEVYMGAIPDESIGRGPGHGLIK
ncbi:MAG: hypothetical protein IT285_03560 [Bdellovibrionales bacterium]|nr:hypothetical protein [Bdellovibrionales bacterium]